jgi:hypothetical protein
MNKIKNIKHIHYYFQIQCEVYLYQLLNRKNVTFWYGGVLFLLINFTTCFIRM